MRAPECDPSPGPLCVGQRFRENYEVTGLIGVGGHAWVYRARHRFMGHDVAIKVLRQDGKVDPDNFRRGLAEAQIQHKLNHPGIVPVMDAGVSETGLLYIVMELQRGRSLRTLLEEHGKLSIEEVLRTALQVAEALQAAHEAKIIHRDVKPENVIVGHGNHVKVIDFGVAKVLDNAGWITQKNMVLGTIYYMSPEQLQARFITAQSDIYALGIVMIEALLGQHPVLLQLGTRERTLYQLTRVIVAEDFPMLDELDARIPRYVAALIYKATVKLASKRFASMQEFARAIRECLTMYERDAREQGFELSTRELWRHKVTSSGVESTQRTAEPPPSGGLQHAQLGDDTNPQSRPLFFGAISSGLLTQGKEGVDPKPAVRLQSADTATAPLGSIIAEVPHTEAQDAECPASAMRMVAGATEKPAMPTEAPVDAGTPVLAEATTAPALVQPASSAHGSEQDIETKPAGHDFKTLARVVAIGALFGCVIAASAARLAQTPSSLAMPAPSAAPISDSAPASSAVFAVAIDAAVAAPATGQTLSAEPAAEQAPSAPPTVPSASAGHVARPSPKRSPKTADALPLGSSSASQRLAPWIPWVMPSDPPASSTKPAPSKPLDARSVASSSAPSSPPVPKTIASPASKPKPKGSDAKPAASAVSPDESWIRVRL
ncbi:MAG: protein kinase domain-containing protein [Myxococcota bacterium]